MGSQEGQECGLEVQERRALNLGTYSTKREGKKEDADKGQQFDIFTQSR